MKVLRKILRKKQTRWQLFSSLGGAFLGISFLLCALQLFQDVNTALRGSEDTLSGEFLVIQKNISNFNTFSLVSSDFSEKEIEEIAKEPFVLDVGVFESSRYSAYASLAGGQNVPQMSTDLFFESVPDQFIDIEPADWQWLPGNSDVPVVLPTHYLESYNFGFAPSQGLPPLSQKAFKLLQYRIRISGNGNRAEFTGRIVGFSDRLNTILVPRSFLDHTNQLFGDKEKKQPSRLILKVIDRSDPKIVKMLEERGCTANKELLEGSRVRTVLNLLLSLSLGISFLILFLAATAFVQYLQVLIGRAKFEIKVLLFMGYSVKNISADYTKWFLRFFLVVVLFAGMVLFAFKWWINFYLREYEFEYSALPGIPAVLALVLVTAGIIIFVSWQIRREVKGLAKNLQ